MSERPKSIPRVSGNNFQPDIIKERQDFVLRETGVKLEHVSAASFDPQTLAGNIENPLGATQVPVGLAGPLLVDGEHAKGHFYVPMATTEGTLVASYSRGMRILSAIGGVKTTIIERYMQRAPVFHFEDARKARDFGTWFRAHFAQIKAAAETTTSIGKLHHIEEYGVSRMWYTRFNFTTGDAAGQNMCGKAADAACKWIMANLPDAFGKVTYTLSGAIDTDKKHSHINTLHSRGARVVVEAVLPRELMLKMTRADTRDIYRTRQISMLGGMLAGTTNNGVHAANGIAALFVATGQDEANVAESQAGLSYLELRDNDDLYWSLTLPSIIAATYGGGTGLATQRECLEILAGTVLAGEISLTSAIIANEWVDSHDKHGRNRP